MSREAPEGGIREDGAAPSRVGAHIVAIGGFDPGGGAGVVRDFLTARAFGASVTLVPTAWTEQSPASVQAIDARDPAACYRAVRGALDGHAAPAVKIGMLPDAAAAVAVGRALETFGGPIVLDPVLRASNGGALWSGDPSALLALAARVTLLTPNADEASILTGLPMETAADAVAAGRALCARGIGAVLVKGGHLGGTAATDTLVGPTGVRLFTGARRPGGAAVRGTGCALATAIAVGLARGLPLDEAITAAKAWLGDALAAAVDVGGERHLP
ncbi:MAG: PfkB family carbohydrate kinase [Pseudomonadota bacterium]